MSGGKAEIKVFIASPGDVLPEREAAYQVIEEVNQTLKDLGEPLYLEVYAWEGRTYPDAGRPQEVILRQIPIEKCDVFIGIFWKRFGTPPGALRPRDGRPYLSGTEEEIDKAFEARRNSPDDRPIIMLYRKMDPRSLIEEEDIVQCSRVIEFFRQCGPDGEHPALVAEFEGDQFQNLLRTHLLQVVKELVGRGEQMLQVKKPHQIPAKPNVSFKELMAGWLNLVGLRDNPFQEHRACSRENLPRFFVQVGRLRLGELVDDLQPWVIFGDEGCGKTSLRMMVAARCYPQTRDSEVFCVEVGADELKTMIDWVISPNLQPQRRLGFPLPEPAPAHPNQSVTTQALRWASAYTTLIAQNLPENILPSLKTNLNTFPPLKALVLTVRSAGFRHLLCLVDEVDMLPAVRGEPAKMADLLAQLMAPELREVEGIAFRYFLPAVLESILSQRRSEFRLDRCYVEHLSWEEKSLKRLLSQRLIAFSRSPLAPRQSLGELCDRTGDFAKRLEDELVTLAEGNPRAAVWLADRLFRFHCQEEPVQRWIQPETWERVKVEWWLRGRSQILGSAGGERGFYLSGDRIYFNGKPVVLPDRYYRLLRCLVQAGGEVCSRDDLARAGWPGENPSGITARAIDEAVRRMRQKLAEQEVDPGLIETIRGRGYRVRTALPTTLYRRGDRRGFGA
ncbi:MAG: winged helix-turn-helix domain-containing protein [Anaerolineae bacterium]